MQQLLNNSLSLPFLELWDKRGIHTPVTIKFGSSSDDHEFNVRNISHNWESSAFRTNSVFNKLPDNWHVISLNDAYEIRFAHFRGDDEATLWVRRGGRGSGKEVDALGLLW